MVRVFIVSVCVLALAAVATAAPENGALWQTASPSAAFPPRSAASSQAFGDNLLYCGGSGPINTTLGLTGIYNDCWRAASSDLSSWTQITSQSLWSPRSGMDTRVLGNTMYLTGGSSSSTYYNDVYSTTDGITWTQLTSRAPWEGRAYHSMGVIGSTMYVLGGANGTGVFNKKNDAWSSTDGITWNLMTSQAPWRARSQQSSREVDGKVLLFGGGPSVQISSFLYNDVWSTADGTTWNQLTSSASWEPRRGQGTTVRDGQIYLLGGQTASNYLNDVWSSPNGIAWTEATNDASWRERVGQSSSVSGSNVVLLGGASVTQTTVWYNDVFTSSPVGPVVSPTPGSAASMKPSPVMLVAFSIAALIGLVATF